jgi:hypothetical protein
MKNMKNNNIRIAWYIYINKDLYNKNETEMKLMDNQPSEGFSSYELAEKYLIDLASKQNLDEDVYPFSIYYYNAVIMKTYFFPINTKYSSI